MKRMNFHDMTGKNVVITNESRLGDLPLAMAYVPKQTWQNLYDPEMGFECGTLFEELNFPWHSWEGR